MSTTPSSTISFLQLRTALAGINTTSSGNPYYNGGTGSVSLNDTVIRNLAGAASAIATAGHSGQISMSNLQNKPYPDNYGTLENSSCTIVPGSYGTYNHTNSNGQYGTYSGSTTNDSVHCSYTPPPYLSLSSPYLVEPSIPAASVCTGLGINSSGLFLMLISASSITSSITSSNGTSWSSPVQITPSGSLVFVVWDNYHNNWICAGANNYTFQWATSSNNGSSWSSGLVGPGNTIQYPNGLAVNTSGLAVSIGLNNYGGNNNILGYYSTNGGSSWTNITITTTTQWGTGGFDGINCLVWASYYGYFIFVAYGGNGAGHSSPAPTDTAYYFTSTNGSSWSQISMGGSYWCPATIAVYGSKIVAVGTPHNAGVSNQLVLVSIFNGTSWSTPATISGLTVVGYYMSLAVSTNGRFLLTVDATGGGIGYYTSSNDGVTWGPWQSYTGSYTQFRSYGMISNSSNLFVIAGTSQTFYAAASTAQA
jgi:hypothetical protein